jgi:hypothetical protein
VSVTYSSPAPPSASISMYSTVSPSAPGAIPHGSLPPPLPHTSAPYHDGSYAPSTIAGRTSLPSMRTIDALAHQVPGMSNGSSSLHHTPSPTLTTTSISSSASTARLYPTILSSNYGLPPDTMARYANLPHNGHALLPRTAKKEIKRRTKTGCLTCRRRRIKVSISDNSFITVFFPLIFFFFSALALSPPFRILPMDPPECCRCCSSESLSHFLRSYLIHYSNRLPQYEAKCCGIWRSIIHLHTGLSEPSHIDDQLGSQPCVSPRLVVLPLSLVRAGLQWHQPQAPVDNGHPSARPPAARPHSHSLSRLT